VPGIHRYRFVLVGTAKRERQKANRQMKLEELAKEAQRSKVKNRTLQIGGTVLGIMVLLFIVSRLANNNDSPTAATTTVAATTTTVDATSTTASDTSTTVAETTTTVAPTTTVAKPFTYGTAPCPAADGSTAKPATFAGAPAKCIKDGATYTAVVETNKGSFTITLDAANAPGNVNNFVTLARYGYYNNNTLCHRVIKGFVVQCGKVKGDDKEAQPGYSVPDELPKEPYAEGIIAVANTGKPDTGGGQWFIITGAQGVQLPQQYSIIGKVTEGYDTTVKALENLADPTAASGVPTLAEIDIVKVTITEK
jgi:cyclophilin family peptidyl-prolyl cis-trans isomerase